MGRVIRSALLGLCLLLPIAGHARDISADEYCLAVNIYYEARAEVEQGMLGVAYVTLNRARTRRQKICRVVFAPKQFSWVEQYQALDEHRHLKEALKPGKSRSWTECKRVAHEAMRHPEKDITQGAEFFVAWYIFPACLRSACSWASRLEFVGMYGNHLFFRVRVYNPANYAFHPASVFRQNDPLDFLLQKV